MIFQDRKVSKIITHPLYEYKRVWNDVGMLFIDEEFTLDDHIFPACLPTKATSDDPEFLLVNCFATGWGRNKFGKESNKNKFMPFMFFVEFLFFSELYLYEIRRRICIDFKASRVAHPKL